MAFQNYKPGKPIFEQEWVGLEHFKILFREQDFYIALRNTLAMSFLGITIGFVTPIVFALLLNEVRNMAFKKTVQTISYLPHFISWVIAASMITQMLSTDGGVVNDILMKVFGLERPVPFVSMPKAFWFIYIAADMWKEVGWYAIIHLAAITGVDQELYGSCPRRRVRKAEEDMACDITGNHADPDSNADYEYRLAHVRSALSASSCWGTISWKTIQGPLTCMPSITGFPWQDTLMALPSVCSSQ